MNSVLSRTLSTIIVLVLLCGLAARPATAQIPSPPLSFNEEFDLPTLDPAWQVVEFVGPRVHSLNFPANRFSLTDNPGYLRYSLDPMTHFDGFLNNYQSTFSFHSCCDHDPGLELHRTFRGENWQLTMKVTYYMPFTNGRSLQARVYFGDGGPNTFSAIFMRTRDINQNSFRISLTEKTGPALSDVVGLQEFSSPDDIPTVETYFFQLERRGSILTPRWSTDGTTWNTAFSRDMGTQLDGLDQRVVLTGLSWFNPAGSYADYDYIRLAPTSSTLLELIQQVDGLFTQGIFNESQHKELRKRLDAAQSLLDVGNPTAACSKLGLFQLSVNRFVTAGALAPAYADPLLISADNLSISLCGVAASTLPVEVESSQLFLPTVNSQ